MNDRLYRSRTERMVAGVAGGVAERFDLDPALVRVLWVVLIFLSGGIFLLLYIAMAVLVPETPDGVDRWAAWGAPGRARTRRAVPGWGSTASSRQAPPPGRRPSRPTRHPVRGTGRRTQRPRHRNPPPSPGRLARRWPRRRSPQAGLPPPAPAGPLVVGWAARPGYRHRQHRAGSGGGAVIAGIVLVLVGGYLLLRTLVPQVDLGAFWPVILIGIGVALVVGSIRPGSGGSPVD